MRSENLKEKREMYIDFDKNNIVTFSTNRIKSNFIADFNNYLNDNTRITNIYFNDGIVVNREDYSFVEFKENIDLDYQFLNKAKSIFLEYTTNEFLNNEIEYPSLEQLRETIEELINNPGILDLKKVYGKGIEKSIDFDYKQLGVKEFGELILINTDIYDKEDMVKMYFNILIELKLLQASEVILFISQDLEIEKYKQWIEYYMDVERVILIIENSTNLISLELRGNLSLHYITGYPYDDVVKYISTEEVGIELYGLYILSRNLEKYQKKEIKDRIFSMKKNFFSKKLILTEDEALAFNINKSLK